jgi:hypothetical protein
MLLAAWRKHLPIHGVEQEPKERGETEEDYLRRCLPHWGIVEHINWSASRFGGADVVLIEGRPSGLDVVNEWASGLDVVHELCRILHRGKIPGGASQSDRGYSALSPIPLSQ